MIKWANKEDSTADPNIMSKVRILYLSLEEMSILQIANLFVRGFDDNVTEMQLREAFGGVEGVGFFKEFLSRILHLYGNIEK